MTFEEFLQKTYNYLKANECWITETYLDPGTHDKPANIDRRYGSELTFESRWSMGGTWSSYTGDTGVVEPDPEPDDPKELDLILECVAPHLSFLQYKAIVREVLQKGTTHDGDYYGGATTSGHKGFTVKSLYEALQKRDLV